MAPMADEPEPEEELVPVEEPAPELLDPLELPELLRLLLELPLLELLLLEPRLELLLECDWPPPGLPLTAMAI